MARTLNYLRPLFVEEQGFRLRSAALAGGVLLAVLIVVTATVWTLGRGTPTIAVAAPLVAVMLAVPLLIAMSRLRVVIDAAGLHIRYFPFIKRTFPLEQIVTWEIMPYDPMEYGGWGVRGIPDRYGWAYSVYGRQGVRIAFSNGHRLMLGTQRPEDLAAALAEAKAHA